LSCSGLLSAEEPKCRSVPLQKQPFIVKSTIAKGFPQRKLPCPRGRKDNGPYQGWRRDKREEREKGFDTSLPPNLTYPLTPSLRGAQIILPNPHEKGKPLVNTGGEDCRCFFQHPFRLERPSAVTANRSSVPSRLSRRMELPEAMPNGSSRTELDC